MARFLPFGSRSRGFTLLEIIVAFVILALVLGATFNTFSIGLRNATLAGDYAGAVVHAEAKLGLAGVAEPLREGVTTGRFDGVYGWRQTIGPILRPDDQTANDVSHRLYEVTVTVFWGGSADVRELTLRTFRMAGRVE